MDTRNPGSSSARSSANRLILTLAALAALVASAILADIAVQAVHDIGIFELGGKR